MLELIWLFVILPISSIWRSSHLLWVMKLLDYAYFALTKFKCLIITLSYNTLPLIRFPYIVDRTQYMHKFLLETKYAISIATLLKFLNIESRYSLVHVLCVFFFCFIGHIWPLTMIILSLNHPPIEENLKYLGLEISSNHRWDGCSTSSKQFKTHAMRINKIVGLWRNIARILAMGASKYTTKYWFSYQWNICANCFERWDCITFDDV